MNPILSERLYDLRRLASQLLALDQLLRSVPLHQQQDLSLDTILSDDAKAPGPCHIESQNATPHRYMIILHEVIDAVLRFNRIPATLVNICKASWRGRIYQNVCRNSDINTSRDPTCSEVLQLLPKLDLLLDTSLGDKINAILSLNQMLVMNFYDIRDQSGAFRTNSPRDRLIIYNMRREIRSCLKKLEIRVLDMDEPSTDRKYSQWENITDEWNRGKYFTETLEALPNLESATVSFEIGENKLEYWTGWYHALGHVAKFLISVIPEPIQIRWDFQPTSDPALKELAEEEEEIMYELKRMFAEETAEREGTVQLGTRLIKDRIAKAASEE
ncbi:hypothetical protein ST47_g5894 [Ascochyta rabiei]|uniref:Uncharacterized protein n=2 Tax=Didymella rabiei TaxID=5454 RepID=A0A163D7B2_DIDRA|nr:hypothetical protein ST47_g5894 [Ascochyta rabiei]